MPLLGKKKFNVLGRSVPRIDGYDKVTGRARFAADRTMEGMLWAGVLRSGYSSARVKRIDTAAAMAIKGVAAVVTFEDLANTVSWAGYCYLTGHIRYQGDCVAMVAAETKALVRQALEAIEAEYEELPAVYEIEDALKEGAPVVHEKYPGNIFTDSIYRVRKGDAEAGFAKADVILEREYRTQFAEHSYIEPEAALAYDDPANGTMTVRASCQNPFFTRRYIADILGEPLNRIRVIQETLGGSFGGKEEAMGLVAARTAYLSRLTGRPVKLVFSREDSFLESAKRHPFRLRYKVGATRDGKVVAFAGEQVANCGAYNNQTQFMNWRANVHSAGAYEIDNIKTDTYGVFTNNVHSGAFRGYSSPQLLFAQEQLIDELAEELGMCELELRRINCLKEGSSTATGFTLREVLLREIMEHTAQKTDYINKRKAYRDAADTEYRKGIGMSIAYRGCSFGAESSDSAGAMIIANDDGSVTINSGLTEIGQGLKTAYAQVTAEVLGVPYESIRFYGADTHSIPDCGMTVASRGTFMGAQPVKNAAAQLKQIMIENALSLGMFPAEKLRGAGVLPGDGQALTPEDVDMEGGSLFIKSCPDIKVPFAAVCNASLWTGKQMSVFAWNEPALGLSQDHETGQGTPYATYSYCCVIAEVGVDMKTGYVDVRKVTSGHDVGTAVNPDMIRGQVYGGIVMGQGYGITEDFELDRGTALCRNFNSYTLPTAMDMPDMDIDIYECEDPIGTFGAKSVGEPATEAVAAAIANAVYNATGRRVRNNPANLENVLLGKKLKKSGRKK